MQILNTPKRLLLAIFLIGNYSFAIAQSGCQDPLAINYDPMALQTDSSCQYATTNWSLTNRISSLPTVLNENSSLIFTDNRLFTNTDGGNPNTIYEIDSLSGHIKKATTIWNYNNVDWEDLAFDDNHLYIGDMGNNDGERTNLRIIKVKKADVYHPDSLQIAGEAIRFSYPDQTSFAPSSSHNFDCEAFFHYQNELHLFTKNRGNKKTTYYTVSTIPGQYTATLKDSFDVHGLITAASIRPDGKVVVLLGYDKQTLQVFAWILSGFSGTHFFSGNKRRIELPGMATSGQTEGICFVDDHRLWVSNEKLSPVLPRVRQFNIQNLIQPFLTPIKETENQMVDLTLVQNGTGNWLNVHSEIGQTVSVFNSNGQLVFTSRIEKKSCQIRLSPLPSGLYFARLTSDFGIGSKPKKIILR